MREFVKDLLRCPRCRSSIDWSAPGAARCADAACALSAAESFPIVDGRPALIDFERSIVSKKSFLERAGASAVAGRRSLGRKIARAFQGPNKAARRNASVFLELLRKEKRTPTILNIGGGTLAAEAGAVWSSSDVNMVAFDIYLSENTDFAADGHHIPLADQSVDGVWIQAVLEHVLDPQAMVDEIHRVLKPDGIVYAESPFMAQVHEGAYDFFRFSHSGHRWLFRQFDEIDSGSALGPGTAMIWSVKYLARAVFRSAKAGTAAGMLFFWLRFFDALADNADALDGALSVYFLGRRSERRLAPQEMISYYRNSG